MAISANIGLMGCGKTYDAVKEKIVPAIAAGRRVVTNIEGINPDNIYDYCERKFGVPAARLGKVISVDIDRPSQPLFFPCKIYPESAPKDLVGKCDDSETIVKAGDLVVVDEARRFWDQGVKISEEHKIFFAELRHYVGSDGTACDMVFATQDFSSIQRVLKTRVELTFMFKKLKVLGLNNHYSIAQFDGNKTTKGNLVQNFTRKYDPEIFPLYKSFSTDGQGKEAVVDRRQNALKKWWLLPAAGLLVAGAVFGLIHLKSFFSGETMGAAKTAQNDKTTVVKDGTPPPPAQSKPSQVTGTTAPVAPPPPPPAPKPSENWRLVGSIQRPEGTFVILSSKEGRTRLMPARGFAYENGRFTSGLVEGEIVGTWTALPTSTVDPRPPRNVARR